MSVMRVVEPHAVAVSDGPGVAVTASPDYIKLVVDDNQVVVQPTEVGAVVKPVTSVVAANVQNPDVVRVAPQPQLTTLVHSNVGAQGPPGVGGGGGAENVYIQQAQPVAAAPWLWIETNPDTTLKTFWVMT